MDKVAAAQAPEFIEPPTVRELLEILGRERVEQALEVKQPSIKAAVANNVMPASWFDVVEQLCPDGVLLSRALFTFKASSSVHADESENDEAA